MRLSYPPKDEHFYEITVCGRRFVAAARGDPYVTDGNHSIQLGHAACVLELHRSWYVCKYSRNEIKFELTGFSESDARNFAQAFGMKFGEAFGRRAVFWDSPAGVALAEYFERFPRRLKRCWWNYIGKPVSALPSAP